MKETRKHKEKRKPKGFGVEKRIKKQVSRSLIINRMLGGDKPVEEIEKQIRKNNEI